MGKSGHRDRSRQPVPVPSVDEHRKERRIMSALARWCYRHRFAVIAAWIGLLINMAAVSQAVEPTNDNSFVLPGTGSGNAQQQLLRSAPDQAGDSDQIVWRASHVGVTNPASEPRMS